MADTDIADDRSMIFTEADIYVITGYLAEMWGHDGDAVEDTEKAITAALARNTGQL